MAEKISIIGPRTDILQGRAYGEAYAKAREHDSYREGQLDTWEIACEAKYQSDLKRFHLKNDAYEDTIKEFLKIQEDRKFLGVRY